MFGVQSYQSSPSALLRLTLDTQTKFVESYRIPARLVMRRFLCSLMAVSLFGCVDAPQVALNNGNNGNNANNSNNSNNVNNSNNSNNSNNANNSGGPLLFRSLDGAVAYYEMNAMPSGDDRLVSNSITEFGASVLQVTDSRTRETIVGAAGIPFNGPMTAVFSDPLARITDSQEMSIEFWYLEDANDPGERSIIRLGGNEGIRINVFRESGGMSVVLDYGETRPYLTQQFTYKNMNHFVITSDDEFLRLYINGVLLFSEQIDGSWVDVLEQGEQILEFNPSSESFGHVDDLAIYDRVLSSVEVSRHMLLGPDNLVEGTTSPSEFAVVARGSNTTDVAFGQVVTAQIASTRIAPEQDWVIRDEDAFYLLNFPTIEIPAPQDQSVSAGMTLSGNYQQSDETELTVYEGLAEWDTSVTWMNPWPDGPRAGTDYATTPVFSGSGFPGGRRVLYAFDITSMFERWQTGSNFGVLMQTTAPGGSLDGGSSGGPAHAPTVIVHGRGTPPEVPEVSASGAFANGMYSLAFSQELDGMHYEVYVDGDLRCVTSNPNCIIETFQEPTNVEVYVHTAFGEVVGPIDGP